MFIFRERRYIDLEIVRFKVEWLFGYQFFVKFFILLDYLVFLYRNLGFDYGGLLLIVILLRLMVIDF